ncbi:MAG: hypothetical protein H7329_09615 [Opitutaceae bacterium]|nr:hypothetical protein [Cytophagales bacterium]
MKKFIQNLLIISVSLGIFSCSKKVTTFNFGKPYHDQQLSACKVQDIKMSDESIVLNDELTTASSGTEIQAAEPVKVNIQRAETTSPATPNKVTNKEKPSFKEKMVAKMLKKKIEKMEKNQALDKKIVIGIVIASIGLLFLILAVAFGGAPGTIFFILGAIGLVAGLLIILLSALDVI